MKKIAIFVEGQTEQFFVKKLLIEMAGAKKVAIELKRFAGKGKPSLQVYASGLAKPVQPQHGALIYDCGGDESVKSRIIEEHQNLFKQGYSEIIGLRDLFPLPDLAKLEARLLHGLVHKGVRLEPMLPANCSIVVAVHEIEAWFLAECQHFACIAPMLTQAFISANQASLGFNPYLDDMSTRSQPSLDLKNLYSLAGKTYNKKKSNLEKTIDCLDYAALYFDLRYKIAKLDELIAKLDKFLTPDGAMLLPIQFR
jgi:Domain of unknown function (DUF4276)